MHHAGLSDGGESQPGSTCALALLQYIARASPEEGQGQSLEVAQQKLPTSERMCPRTGKVSLGWIQRRLARLLGLKQMAEKNKDGERLLL